MIVILWTCADHIAKKNKQKKNIAIQPFFFTSDKNKSSQVLQKASVPIRSLKLSGNEPFQGLSLTINNRRCPWCNGYRRRIWTLQHEFKSWT